MQISRSIIGKGLKISQVQLVAPICPAILRTKIRAAVGAKSCPSSPSLMYVLTTNLGLQRMAGSPQHGVLALVAVKLAALHLRLRILEDQANPSTEHYSNIHIAIAVPGAVRACLKDSRKGHSDPETRVDAGSGVAFVLSLLANVSEGIRMRRSGQRQ